MPRKESAKGGSSAAYNKYDVINASQYKCSVGGEWKPRGNFSQKNHNLLENKVKMGVMVTPANTGMRCRDHSGEPRLERRCEGPCNKVKPLSSFSKNNLTNGLTWCQSCTHWQLSQDDYPTAEIEYEDGLVPPPAKKPMSLSTLHGGDDDKQSATASSYSAAAQGGSLLRASDTDIVSGRLFGPASRASGSLPPHLRSVIKGSEGGTGLDDVDIEERYYPDDESLLPGDSASQYDRPDGSQLGSRPTKLTSASLHEKEQTTARGQGPRYFNSWDNAGRQHLHRRGGDSDVGTVRSFGTQKISTIRGSEGGRTQHTAPKICEPEKPGKSRKFARIPRIGTAPPPVPEWTENDVYIDDEGSEPDLP